MRGLAAGRHCFGMARRIRDVRPGVPNHVWQRGNHQETVFRGPEDCRLFLGLLQRRCADFGVAVYGYCLMTNHYHLVVEGAREDSMSLAIGQVNREYSAMKHLAMGTKGQLWQGRFGSCVLDDAHFWTALCYVERNPVAAGLVEKPWEWAWSSARTHLGMTREPWIALDRWRESYNEESWRRALDLGIQDQALEERIILGKIWYQQNPVTRYR
jgi:putative transposase